MIQNLLDHLSPAMTAIYAKLHDKTLRRHWENALKVNHEGREAEISADHPLAGAAWAKMSLVRAKVTLPNGYCGAPVQTDCEYANPCLDCRFFITTGDFLQQHRQQRQETSELIAQAEEAGLARVAEKNHRTLGKLDTIISALEGPPRTRSLSAARWRTSMPPADNTAALAEATRRRSERARRDAEKAISAAHRTGNRTSFAAIAKAAGVSRSWLYTQPDLVAAIRQLQDRQPATERTGSQPASVASVQRRLETALARIKKLRAENSDLAGRLETAYGEIRRLRGVSPG
ncbi:DUF6262 family protein [Streptomyces sp. ISL-98]|uniref:DUF6262 family protein n=1 Tax=Streptomyces sp. ISL-98 TaxID=2819192 RepID=UPI0027E582E3|nr:DUF6262 family protein [Streptomyces sp. ISL-98]